MKLLDNFNRNVSINKRITLGFVFILIAMVIAGLVGVYSIEVARKNFVRYRQLNERAVSIVEIDNAVVELQRNISNYTHTGRESIQLQVNNIIEDLNKSLNELESLLIGDTEKVLTTKMKTRLKNYSVVFANAIKEQNIKDDLVKVQIPKLVSALRETNVKQDAMKIELDILHYLNDPRRSLFQTVNLNIKNLAKKTLTSKQQEILANLKAQFLRASQATRSYLYLVNVVMAGDANEFKYISKKIKSLILEQSTPIKNQIEVETKETQHITIIFLLLSLLVGGAIAWLIAAGISKPLRAITETFKLISRGDEDVIIAEQDRKDEIGVLSRAANIFHENNKKLSRSHEELQQFSYRTSHDLRAPLTTSKRLSEFIYSDIDAGDLEEAKRNSLKITKQMQNLEGLIVDILDLARADLAGNQKNSIDFPEMISDIKERLSWMTEENECQLLFENKILSKTVGDKVRFSQVLENLISNGIKYRDVYKSRSFVHVLLYDDQNCIYITVKDNGLGIPKDKLDDIFKMFQRFHPEVAEGSGLGLSLVKKHIDFMAGRIVVDSSAEGTQFNIEIPKNNN